MNVLDKSFVSDTLVSCGITPSEALMDKIMDFRRLLQVRFQGSRSPPHRTAVIIEIACRNMNLDCPRGKLLINLGLKITPNEYRTEMVTCEAALGIKRNSQQLISTLSVKYGGEYVQRLQSEANLILSSYIDSLPIQQRQFINIESPTVIGSLFHLVSQRLESKLSLDEIATIADCSKAQLTGVCNKMKRYANSEEPLNPSAEKTIQHSNSSQLETVKDNQFRIRPRHKYAIQLNTPATVKMNESGNTQRNEPIFEIAAKIQEKQVTHLKSVVASEEITHQKVENSNKRAAYEAWKAEQFQKKR